MKKALQLLLLGVFFTACENAPESHVQKTTIDDICFSYYLTNRERKETSKFVQGEMLFIHLDIQNNRPDTIMAYAEDLGECYDSNKHIVECMSFYVSPDSLPMYKTILPNASIQFTHSFMVTIPAGMYNYKNPHASIHLKENKNNIKEYTLPLNTIFKIK